MSKIPAFDIQTLEDFFKKLLDERSDLKASHDLNTRHALNAILTACHLTDWAWETVVSRSDLHKKWGLHKPALCCFRAFIEERCPLQRAARHVANGTKHAKIKPVVTSIREGAFDVSGFQSNAFQVSCLMVTTDDQTYSVSAFLDKLIVFWREFLTTELNLTISST